MKRASERASENTSPTPSSLLPSSFKKKNKKKNKARVQHNQALVSASELEAQEAEREAGLALEKRRLSRLNALEAGALAAAAEARAARAQERVVELSKEAQGMIKGAR